MTWRRSHTHLAGVYLAIAAISALHYSTGTHAHQLHDVYRRLYYLPIILAAFLHGLPGGLAAAAIVCLAYFPHAFGHVTHDPAGGTEKALEMLLYLAVGLVTGGLVSHLKRAQGELQGSLERLRSTERQLLTAARLAAVGRLSAGLAHEIRNPLASIKGSAEILADDFPTDHRKHRMLRVLIGESERLDNVLTRFLAFARPRALERRSFAFGSEVEDVIALLEGRVEQDVTIHQDRIGTLPEVWGDREQLRQLLLNLLLNACQAAGSAGSVWVQCSADGSTLHLSIRDSGAGFRADALENAFTPFFTTREQGSGLGLAVSHRIVELHGGSIQVSNDERGGGRVDVVLPLRGTDGQDPADR